MDFDKSKSPIPSSEPFQRRDITPESGQADNTTKTGLKIQTQRLELAKPPAKRRTEAFIDSLGFFRRPINSLSGWVSKKSLPTSALPASALERSVEQQPTGQEILSFQRDVKINTPPKEIISTLLAHMPYSEGYALVALHDQWHLCGSKGEVRLEPVDESRLDQIMRRNDRHQLRQSGELPLALRQIFEVIKSVTMPTLIRVDALPNADWLCFPLSVAEKPKGLIMVKAQAHQDVGSTETLQAVGSWKEAGELALEQAHLFAQQEQFALQDELTKLPNLRFFNNNFPSLLNEAEQHQAPVCVLAIDIDHLKAHNTRGWEAGDQVITRVSTQLQSRFRDVNLPSDHSLGDLLVRAHGDELIGVLPRCHIGDAIEKAERLVRLVHHHVSDTLGVPVSVTVGLASNDDLDTSTPDARTQLLKKASDALTEGKNQQQRNQVHSQLSQGWVELGKLFGLENPKAMLFEPDLRSWLSVSTAEDQIIKLTVAHAQTMAHDEKVSQLQSNLCLRPTDPKISAQLVVPSKETLDKVLDDLKQCQSSAFQNTAQSSVAAQQRFGILALGLSGYKRQARLELETCLPSHRQQHALKLIEDLEKIHGKENHSAQREQVIERLSSDEQLSQGLSEQLNLSPDALKQLWEELSIAGRYMNLGEASVATALPASARTFTPEQRRENFQQNFKRTADLLRAFDLAPTTIINIIEQIRYGEAQTPASQLLDLVDQVTALQSSRPNRGALPAERIAVILKENGQRYGIDPHLTALIIQTI